VLAEAESRQIEFLNQFRLSDVVPSEGPLVSIAPLPRGSPDAAPHPA
jgi:hypothetical protein